MVDHGGLRGAVRSWVGQLHLNVEFLNLDPLGIWGVG